MVHQPSWRRLGALAAAFLLLVATFAAAAAPASASNPRPGDHYRVLVFTGGKSTVTAAGVAAIRQLGRQHRFTVDVTADPAAFTPANLDRYATVVFLNTAGDRLDDAQQAAYEGYFTAGGGFVGIHSAIEAEPEWEFLTGVLGTRAAGVTDPQPATIEVADRVHPASASLPEYWQVTDGWYDYTDNVRGVSHVLATVDEQTYDGGAMGFDHPVTWCKDYQGGRSFYTGRGGTRDAYRDRSFGRHLLGAIRWAAGRGGGDCGATVLANYEMTVIASQPNVGEPIGFDVLPDGRVMQTSRTGEVRLHEADGSASQVIATVPVYTHSEDGLYGPTLDPNFAQTGWVYLYYAPPLDTPAGNAPVTSTDPDAWEPFEGYFQLSRFRFVDGDEPSLDLASEQQILRVPVIRGTCCHVAGEIRFDSRGNLLLATGDDTNAGGSDGYAPINDQAPPASEVYRNPAYDARRTAGNTNHLGGKLLRIRVRADGGYTIPKGNLFKPGTPRTRPEIYAMGLRNPFRINLDDRDRVYVTDYSPDARVANPARGPEGTGRMMVVDKPGNYGWPYCVQPNLPYFEYDFTTGQSGEAFDCTGPTNTSRHNDGRTTLPEVERSELWYTFNAVTPCPEGYLIDPPQPCAFEFPELGTGGVGPHGAAPYHYDRRLDSPTKFPEYYDDAIFFGEFTRDYLREIRLDRRGEVFAINPLLNCGGSPVPFLCDNPMDMKWGPDGNFYLLTYGDGFFRANPDALMVKFSYNKGQRAPVAAISAEPTSGPAPLTVQFGSEGTHDPDPGDAIELAWDFDGNGTTDSTEPAPTHTYTDPGQYPATLTVTDSNGLTGATNTIITVGNTAPTVQLTAPVEGGLFSFGDAVPWSVNVTDPEDGAIDCNRVEVTFVLGHDEHGHAGATQNGCSGVYQTEPSDADHAGGHLFGAFSASYTDLGGPGGVPPLTTIDQVSIQQRHQEVEYRLEESSTNVQATDDAGGGQHLSSLNDGSWIRLRGSYQLLGIDSLTFRVRNASADTQPGGPLAAVEVRLGAVDGPLLATAELTATGGTGDWQSQTFPVTDPGGIHDLYLVFRTVPGGPTGNNTFLLNWVEFGGPGVAE
jgi:PKD repeat protein/glucose/arabinose dehydrogenase